MPPRRRQREDDEQSTPKPRTSAKADGEICAECWPNGWRDGSTNAGCLHGTWTR